MNEAPKAKGRRGSVGRSGPCREEEAVVGITASVYLMRPLSYKC